MKQFSELGFPPEQQLFESEREAMMALFELAFEVLLELQMTTGRVPSDRQIRKAIIPLINRYRLHARPTVEQQVSRFLAATAPQSKP